MQSDKLLLQLSFQGVTTCTTLTSIGCVPLELKHLLFGFCVVQLANDEVTAGEGEMIELIQQTFCMLSTTKQQPNLAYLFVLFEYHLGDNNYKIPI